MSLLYPQLFWLFIPLGVLAYILKPRSLVQSGHLVILGLIIIALSRPQLDRGIEESPVDAKNILIALDVSYSMRAQDIKPDRYSYAKETIHSVLSQNQKDNIMLIAFTSNPLILAPPTTDHPLILTALDALEPKNILTKGTSLEKLFKQIASLKKVHRDVILITDGGEENSLTKLQQALQESDSRLIILAMGTRKGTTIPTENGTMLKDRAHRLVISRINPILKQLAETTGGVYLTASSSPEESAEAIQKALNSNESDTTRTHKQHHTYTELYVIPLLLATLLFFMLHTHFSRYLLLLAALAHLPLEASLFDAWQMHRAYHAYEQQAYEKSLTLLERVETPSLQQRYALASAHYNMGHYTKARRLYRAIRTTSPKIKQQLFYNIANTYALEGVYDKAVIYYTKALQLGKDPDAAYNLTLVMRQKQKKDTQLGIAHPKSQSDQSSNSDAQESDKEQNKERKEDQPSSGSGSGGQYTQKSNKEKEKKGQLKLDEKAVPQPLSSKVYELINKGYIRETQPW